MACRVIGHRGARGLFPENTSEGIAAAAALGVRCFEVDVGATRDGVAVVHHDPALNPDIARDAAGCWIEPAKPSLLRELTAAELGTFDVGSLRPGSRTRAAFPGQKGLDGIRVPALRDLLAANAEWDWFVEVKTHPDRPGAVPSAAELAALSYAAADAARATPRCTFIGFEWAALRSLRASCADVRLAWSTRPATLQDAPTWLGLPCPLRAADIPSLIADEGGGGWVPDEASVTPALVEQAHRLSIAVTPWTVNDPDRMRELAGYGVDGIITDYPDRLLEVLAEAGP